jgi:hypothetical protein
MTVDVASKIYVLHHVCRLCQTLPRRILLRNSTFRHAMCARGHNKSVVETHIVKEHADIRSM